MFWFSCLDRFIPYQKRTYLFLLGLNELSKASLDPIDSPKNILSNEDFTLRGLYGKPC